MQLNPMDYNNTTEKVKVIECKRTHQQNNNYKEGTERNSPGTILLPETSKNRDSYNKQVVGRVMAKALISYLPEDGDPKQVKLSQDRNY